MEGRPLTVIVLQIIQKVYMWRNRLFIGALAIVVLILGITFWINQKPVRVVTDEAGVRHRSSERSHAATDPIHQGQQPAMGSADNHPGSVVPVAPGVPTEDDLALPLMFRGSGAADSALNPQQQEIVRKIQEDFAAAISQAGKDPSSPEYRETWAKAKKVAETQLRLQLGTQDRLLYERAQSQVEYSESHGTRIAPPAR